MPGEVGGDAEQLLAQAELLKGEGNAHVKAGAHVEAVEAYSTVLGLLLRLDETAEEQQAATRNKPQSNKAQAKAASAAATRRELRVICFANRAMCRLQLGEDQTEGVIADCGMALQLLQEQVEGGEGWSPSEAAAAEKLRGKVLYRRGLAYEKLQLSEAVGK